MSNKWYDYRYLCFVEWLQDVVLLLHKNCTKCNYIISFSEYTQKWYTKAWLCKKFKFNIFYAKMQAIWFLFLKFETCVWWNIFIIPKKNLNVVTNYKISKYLNFLIIFPLSIISIYHLNSYDFINISCKIIIWSAQRRHREK